MVERRRAERIPAAEWTSISRARVRPGPDVLIVNVSRCGVLVECASAILPGQIVVLEVCAGHTQWETRGAVVRAFVTMVEHQRARYRGAIEFDRRIELWQMPNSARVEATRTGE